jgi:ABC-type multidrug transport system fused ATPase/permease subunit
MFRTHSAGQRRSFVGAVLLMALEAATAIVVPIVIGDLTDHLVRGKPWARLGLEAPADLTIPLFAAAIIAFTAVNSISDAMSEISLAKAGRTLGYNLRAALFAHLQRLSLAFHLRRSTGDVLTRITGDVQAVEEFVTDSVKDLVGSVLLLAGTLTYLFTQNWRVALLAMAVVPVMSVVSQYFAKRIKTASKEMRAREGEVATTAQEMLTTISVVQTYGRAAHEQEKFDRESRGAMASILRTARLEALFGLSVSVVEATIIATLVVLGSRLVEGGTLRAGDLVAFILLIQNMFKPTRRIIKQWNRVAKVYASVERIDELLGREPDVQDAPDAVPAPRLSGAVEFRDVSFAYQQPPGADGDSAGEDGAAPRLTLQSVSFTIDPGEVVALLGHSGAGKSTVAQLLPRLYDPQAGAVLVDGYDIRAFTIDSLRAQISMVLQETILLRGTVAENIAYGREGATFDDVVTAAHRAHAHDFIMALPQGYDTALGERAATLSGGQRQRLAIARAFIRDTPILVLDEPTTGLDAQASASVADALAELVQGRSAVIVSHDLNLIRRVDRILVLSGGRILEEGTPADLLERGGLYADLYASQFGEAMAEAVGASDAVEAVVEVPVGGVPVGAARVGAEPRVSGAELEVPGPRWVYAGEASHDLVSPDGDDTEEERDSRFETALHEALPRAATPREYGELRGWEPRHAAPGARAAHPHPEVGADADPLRSPAVAAALPGLAAALDPDAMAPRLAAILRDGWVLESCVADKVDLDPGGCTRLRYRLRLRGPGGEATEEHVGGRLFADPATAQAYAAGHPVAAGAGSDWGPFATSAELVDDLRLVLHPFPFDADLPGLPHAADPTAMGNTLREVLPRTLPGLELQRCRPEVAKYAVGDHCVLRYELLWRVLPSRRTVRQVVYGRLHPDGRGERVGPLLDHLRDRLSEQRATFLLPRSQGWVPELGLALVDALPGTPQVRALARRQVGGDHQGPGEDLDARRALAACAGIAAALHEPVPPGLALPGDRPGAPEGRTLAGDLDRLGAQLADLQPWAPGLVAGLAEHADALAAFVDASEPMPPVLVHGDFGPAEVLLDGPVSAVFDLDAATRAEPAVDVGHFLARLTLSCVATAGREGLPRALALERDFLERYAAAHPGLESGVLWPRVAAHRATTLLGVAARSWRQAKPERVRLALTLLGEPSPVRQKEYR